MSEYRLTQEIIELSVANTWNAAKLEWKLFGIYFDDAPQTCLCGHYPIIEICTIENHRNGNVADVGNCCVKKFLGLPSDKIFQAIKRVRKDHTKSLNEEAIGYAYDRGWINGWERSFCLDTMHKRKLTARQLEKREQINDFVLSRLSDSSRG